MMRANLTGLKDRVPGPVARSGARAIGVLVFVSALGCGGGTVVTPPTDQSNLRGIVRVYGIAARDLGRPPQKIEDLTAIYRQADPDPEKYVRSARDGQEFVVVWGLNIESAPADMVVAYERTGVDGKRMVVTADGMIREVTTDDIAQLKFPKNHKPEI
jgi:hypothetical protein